MYNTIIVINCFNFLSIFILFIEKYEYVGRLLRPGEEPNSYSDEEEESPNESNNSNKSDTTAAASGKIENSDKPKDD